MAMFMDKKLFPLPGLKEVTTNTFCWVFLFFIKSTLERSTRKASLIMFRLLSSTTITCSGDLLFFFLLLRYNGISPKQGTLRFSKSFLPRTLVFIFSCIKIITAGTKSPRTRATNKMFFLFGAVGKALPRGAVIIRVL